MSRLNVLKYGLTVSIFICLYVCSNLMMNTMNYYSSRRAKKLVKLGGFGGINDRASLTKKRLVEYLIKDMNSSSSLEKLDRTLNRVGYKGGVYDFIVNKYLYTLLMGSIGIVLYSISISISILCMIFSIMIFFHADIWVEDRLKKLNSNIVKEFPRLARTLRYSPHINLIDTIGDYLSISRGPLHYDLKILHAKLESGMGEKEALRDFSSRIGINEITNYIMAVITALDTSKENVDTLYAIQEEKIRTMNINNIKSQMNKRPEILERINATVIYSIMGLNVLAIVLSFYYDFIKQI